MLLLVFFNFVPFVFSQKTKIPFGELYGLNQELYNGRRYIYFPPLQTGGHQFLEKESFSEGIVSLRGKLYTDLLLNFDIYHQQLVMRYSNQLGATEQLIISDAWLQDFSFGGKKFEQLQMPDSSYKIAQVIGKKPFEILVFWHKNLSLDTRFGATNHSFSKALKKTMLRNNELMLAFKNKRNFVKLFPKVFQSDLKKYMRKQHFSFKKSSDEAIAELLFFCSSNLSEL
ncbi:MAG: hypothetical protein RBR87_07660 [Bacteroidales bacterium]|nr:hypothetical protein [Bacteroidales bacterium]